jgi:hypothetical protein
MIMIAPIRTANLCKSAFGDMNVRHGILD